MGKRNTGCCWHKLSEFKSLESSDSAQRNAGGQGDPGRQPDSQRKCVAGTTSSSVRPDCFPPLFESGLVARIFCFSLGRESHLRISWRASTVIPFKIRGFVERRDQKIGSLCSPTACRFLLSLGRVV